MRREISSQISNGKNPDRALNNETELQYGDITHIIGYPISKHLYDSFNSTANQPENIMPSASVLILSISLMDQPAFGMKHYSERLKKAGTPVVLKHLKAEPFWDRYWQWKCKEAADTTLQWIQTII